ncbi:MAG: hypothetical protein R3342_13215 [Lutibacter sp.]|uniref:hypothetical protein n=1 Tax=Lutibacter sp. TaxID=1925666 RepID=UPI00299DAFFC|nr:hypothetical protein [Lutibacter sp.]MDX1830493.1 hypothetical protein [Lutibacter sp.]
MKQFLKYIISISISTIALLYLCDFIYTQVYINSNPRNKLQYILNTKNESFDIIFIGSSRVANHIDTKLFDSLSNKKTINLGVEGAGLNDNLLQLKLLIANNNISNVFLQIDSNFEYDKPSNIAISEAMPFLNYNNIINTHIKKYFNNFEKLEYIPFYRYAINDPKIGFREMFFSVANKKPRTNPSIGFTPKFGNKLPLIESSLPKTIKLKNIILDEITDICRKNKIQLTLYISPYCSKTKNMRYIEKLITKVPNLIDLSKGYDDKLFFNCGHLNNQGAKIFTTNLYNATKNKIKS